MARVSAERVLQTKRDLLEAARLVLTRDGLANLSTRAVAQAAGTQEATTTKTDAVRK